jgi:flagellar biosynthesis protein FlhB
VANNPVQQGTASAQTTPSNNLVGGSPTATTDLSKAMIDLLNINSTQLKQTEHTLDQIKETQKQINETRTLVIVGFIAIVVIVAGFVMSYIQLSVTTYGSFLDKINTVAPTPRYIIVTPTPSYIPKPT